MSVNNDKAPAMKALAVKKRKWTHLITAAVLDHTRWGRKPEPPTHTPDQYAKDLANNDPRLTRSGVIMVAGNHPSGGRRDRPT
jgi:hypothetical protein